MLAAPYDFQTQTRPAADAHATIEINHIAVLGKYGYPGLEQHILEADMAYKGLLAQAAI